jgi:hypothetical protein
MSTNAIALLSLVATIGTVIAAVVIYRLQRDRKNLAWYLISATKLLRDKANPIRELELRYKGEVIRDPYLLQLRFINNGNKPITAEDYKHPLRVSASDSRVLSAEVVETSQTDMGAKMSIGEQEATLDPLLLNPGDWVSWQILLDSVPSRWEVNGRIVGVREVRPYKARRGSLSPLTKTILTVLGIVSFFAFLFASENEYLVARIPILRYSQTVTVGAIAIAFGIFIVWSIYDQFSRSDRSRV